MCNLLLVDGSSLMRDVVGQRLRLAGHIVRDAGDVSEALELLHGSAVDIAIIELQLPRGKSGIDFMKVVRGDENFKVVPLIVYTSTDDPALEKDAMRLNAVAVFHKDRADFEDVRHAVELLSPVCQAKVGPAKVKTPRRAAAFGGNAINKAN